MNYRLLITALFALNIGVMTTSATEDEGMAGSNPAMGAAGLITVSATVAEVDQESREVTLVDEKGDSFVVSVGDEVKNLAQVEVGDQVDVAYYEAVTIEVLGPDQERPGMAAASAVETAKPGEKPAGVAAEETAVVATVEGIDKDAQTVTLMGPEGGTRTLKVRNPANLEKVAVGDQILITFTRAVAVGVTEGPAGD